METVNCVTNFNPNSKALDQEGQCLDAVFLLLPGTYPFAEGSFPASMDSMNTESF